MKTVPILVLLAVLATTAFAAEPEPAAVRLGSTYEATDTLSCDNESKPDAKDCLASLSWKPTKFTVRLEAAEPGRGDFLVRFPSPKPVGNAKNDLVSMEWFAARDANGEIRRARPIVVVHESAHSMTVGRMIARNLRAAGLHAFLINLPDYGPRRFLGKRSSFHEMSAVMRQGIADTRRARDAVAALPVVDPIIVGLQGTSLGGFVVSTVAGLDHGYDRIFILLAGGDIEYVIFHGSRDAEKARDKLHASGLSDDEIKALAHEIEPLRLAHRIDPAATWLYSGTFDTVVPARCSLELVKAARLPEDHHIRFAADHYLGIIYLPQAIQEMSSQMLAAAKKR